MPEESFTRKLAAIFYCDVAGYSRLTGVDEEGTHKVLSAYLDIISNLIKDHGGRVLHYAGDAILADFDSIVVAVNCAVDVQCELTARNEGLNDDRKVLFRIGVNLGDVIVDRGEIYGNGVNMAARMESLAAPGGICIPRKVMEEVRDKLEIGYEYLGEKSVKNIKDPIPVYQVVLAPEVPGQIIGESLAPHTQGKRSGMFALAAAILLLAVSGISIWWWQPQKNAPTSVDQMSFPLPDKPSVAVLPFDNLSNDPSQEYMADGITEDIITALSQVSDLFVISRNSTFTYKGTPVKVQKVAADLGVRFVLEGSIQKSGENVRINAQLIDALSGNHLWAERFDRKMTDIFSLQDEITEKIVTSLQIKLTAGEEVRVHRRHTRNLEAWNLVAKGIKHFYGRSKSDNELARQFFADAIKIDPDYAVAYAVTAWTHWFDAQFGWVENPEQSLEIASLMAEKAGALNDELPDVYALQGAILLFKGQYDAAVASGEKAVALNPNHATNTALLAMLLHNTGRLSESISKMKKAMRLSPYYPAWFLEELGFIYLDANRYEDALVAYANFIEREPSNAHTAHVHIGRALAYHGLGHDDAARGAVADAIEVDSNVSLARFRLHSLNKDLEAEENALSILRRLGLPD